MNTLKYLSKPVEIPGSTLAIIALDGGGSPYALKRSQIRGLKEYDLPYAFPLMPFLTRQAESGEDVPDYKEVQSAVQKAKSLTGKVL